MIRNDDIVGVINVYRQEVRPFTEEQISLLENFASQAVIAIENARLFNETREALERQTATADILKVIASSPSDVQPVFEAIAERSNRLVEGLSTAVYSIVDDTQHLMAFTRSDPEADAALQASFPRPLSGATWGDRIRNGEIVQIPDFEATTEWAEQPTLQKMARLRGFRGLLFIPLRRDGATIGLIGVSRKEPGAFAAHHVQLLQTFADQAVIAIGNVRLFDEVQAKTRELTESLDYQIATADVLNVIGRSTTNVQPVFEAIASSAARLFAPCETTITTVHDGYLHWRATASLGRPVEAVERVRAIYPLPCDIEDSPSVRAIRERRIIEIADAAASDTPKNTRLAQRTGEFRSITFVPLLGDGIGIGTIILTHPEAGFKLTPKQMALVQTFADQAVIAIENARLFDEVRAKTRDLTEALTYQTGSANILKVIASSPTDVGPVLEAIVGNAAELCDAYDAAVVLRDGDDLRFAAHHGPIPIGIEKWPINRRWTAGRAFIDQKPVHIEDLRDESHADFSDGRELSLRMGHRSILSVPLLREGESIGAIVLRRTEVHPFSDKQITLLQTFADQAVIAIGNVRLFEQVQTRTRELSASLEDLRAAQDRLVQTEKLASLGQLTAGIAHEIKNPLNFVNNFSALSAELTDELNDTLKPVAMDGNIREEVDELTGLLKSNLEKVVQHGKRADSIVKNMLLHSREGSREHRPADINSLLDESLNLAYHGARAEKGEFNITLQRDFDADAGTIELFPQEITRAFLNLIANGVYAATRRKAEDKESGFEPTLRATTKNLGTTVEIRIRDNGIGIPVDVQEKMFNPFFTTKPAGEGTGLGLSMTHDIIVKQHGGRIDVETEPGVFTEFVITLPRAIISPKTAGGTN